MKSSTPRTCWRLSALLGLAVLLGAALPAPAGVIFLAGQWDAKKGTFTPADKAPLPAAQTRYSNTTVTIAERRVQVRIEETLDGRAGTADEVLCLLPLPAGVLPTAAIKFEPLFNWAGLPTILDAAAAQPVYEAVARTTGQVKLLAYSGRPALLVSTFPAKWLSGKVQVTVDLSYPVTDEAGLLRVAVPMPAADLGGEPIARVALTATIADKLPLRALFSPSHELTVERPALTQAKAQFTLDQYVGSGDFLLYYVADLDPLGLRLLAHRAADETEGFFMLIGNPTGSPTPEQPTPKDLIFALDVSGSMRGDKLEQARSAIEFCLKQLNPEDRFNIVTFGSEVRSFRPAAVACTAAAVAAGRTYLDELIATGRTNIGGALAAALAGQADPVRPRMLIFLTDGTPTAGECDPEKILAALKEQNASRTRVFVVGLGHDVNVHLLDKLAEDTNGSSEYVGLDGEIDAQIAALYNRLSDPVLDNPTLAIPGLKLRAVFPQKLPTLFKGSELLVCGRYTGGGKQTVTLNGTRRGQPVTYTYDCDFPAQPGPANEFVAPLWAARNIGFFLQQIRLHGENPELIEEVVRLSRRYGIVTEYTAFIAASGGDVSMADAKEHAKRNLEEARAEKAGQWAVQQAQNEQALQGRAAPAAVASNVYRDRQGRVQNVESVRQVGKRAFYQKDGRWVEVGDDTKRADREVKLFSKEYFDLLRSNKDFAEAQSLGKDISVNVGNERITVKE